MPLKIAPRTTEAASLLCVANYRSNAGYAWDFIESLYARIADHVAEHGIRTLVAYPAIQSPPRTLEGSAAQPVEVDVSLESWSSLRSMMALIRRYNVRVIYFTSYPVRSWAYWGLRLAGARHIVMHDHSSGDRTAPRGFKRAVKWLLARLPGLVPDVVVAVSDYVARRQWEVAMIPSSRVVRVWNGLPVRPVDAVQRARGRELVGVPPDRFLVVCACRASQFKGVDYLLRAFDQVVQRCANQERRPLLLYAGNGPFMPKLRALHQSLAAANDMVLLGYRPDAAVVVDGADLCVVPSVWQDALPLAVLEAMARGKPVIATQVGGIPEMVENGVSGILVPPGDDQALANAMFSVVANPAKAAALGEAAQRRVAEQFTPQQQILGLTALIEQGFGEPCPAVRDACPRAARP
ncbi:MAG: glycosyltransferase family 4 protein [Terriglobales bacterium]